MVSTNGQQVGAARHVHARVEPTPVRPMRLACSISASSPASLRYAASMPSTRNRRANVPRCTSSQVAPAPTMPR